MRVCAHTLIDLRFYVSAFESDIVNAALATDILCRG